MADIQTLEQRFEGISVQDENMDINAPSAPQHKPKVCDKDMVELVQLY